MKKENDKIQSRREFFKKAISGVLPILGAVMLGNVPNIVKAVEKEPMGCSAYCEGSCYRACYHGCNMTCMESCKGACQGSCQGTCRNSCSGSCSGSCYGMSY
ncbi:Cys-Xaa-Xaa-Xaa repeat radical SAM target protein [uncultured Prevotella sp.]|uniref:Cys-Xaa-Xaa-Xaa repeat radical SAM target protein n=1 Tax=uncultured Prevotella sp. TaxID=159272 RepID=UPI00341ACC4A